MAPMANGDHQARERAMLSIRDLHVYYGESHAIQGIELNLPHGILSVVGRNGMGKTTLCNTIMGLTPARRGSIRFNNREIRGRTPNVIANLGIGYVPQGRRIWPSLTVDEHLRLAMRGGEEGAWSVDRIYTTFPGLPSGAAMAAHNYRAVSSRCSRFPARCWATLIY